MTHDKETDNITADLVSKSAMEDHIWNTANEDKTRKKKKKKVEKEQEIEEMQNGQQGKGSTRYNQRTR